MSHPAPNSYITLLGEIKQRIRSAQYEALKAVNKELIGLYWDIGRMIVERQKGKTWGKSVVEQLASDPQAEFPGIRGFSAQNLWKMKQFFESYSGDEKLSTLSREIGWIQIENQTYEKTLLNQVNFDKTLPEEVRNRAKLAVKDEHLFDFLELGEEFSEREFEKAAISRIEAFLRQMGGVYTFAGSQQWLAVLPRGSQRHRQDGGREPFHRHHPL